MVTLSLYVRKGGVHAQGLHSPITCESADFPSAHPQLVSLRRYIYISILAIDPTYFINAYGQNPTSQKTMVLPGCHGWLGLVIGSFG